MSIAENIRTVYSAIDAAARRYGRTPDSVNLIAVSKQQPEERIDVALRSGLRIFGENRVQEAEKRWVGRRAAHPDLVLHLIGPLQSNKAKEAVGLFDVIETLDREKLAVVLAAEMEKQGRSLPCLIQVNTGEEAQKSGISPRDLPEFLDFCRSECKLDIRGLMCLPPLEEPPELHFALLAKLSGRHGLERLSMGMSGDYESAIALGATHLRIGTALFGERIDSSSTTAC